MEFEIKEKIRQLEKEEKDLERKYNYDVKTEIDAEIVIQYQCIFL